MLTQGRYVVNYRVVKNNTIMNQTSHTKTSAIREAQNIVGKPYVIAGGWQFLYPDHKTGATRTSNTHSTFVQVRNARAQRMIEEARRLIGKDPYVQYDGGNWKDYV
jgi:hypothetical protein